MNEKNMGPMDLCKEWFKERCSKTTEINESAGNNYSIKHRVEEWAFHVKKMEGVYIPDEAVVEAALALGISMKKSGKFYHFAIEVL